MDVYADMASAAGGAPRLSVSARHTRGSMEGRGYYVASLDPGGRRVSAKGLFARGNGQWVLDGHGLSFLRTLTHEPIRISSRSILAVALSRSSWRGGKWLLGARVVEVTWAAPDGSVVTSGFVFAGRRDENARAAEALKCQAFGAAHAGDRTGIAQRER